MTAEKERILKMVENGKITADDATKLLDALESTAVTSTSIAVKGKGKKLRVKVDGLVEGQTDGNQKIKVDVAVPLALGSMIDGILENCVPLAVQDELKKQGIDISSIRIGEILETMGDIDEDIVNADIDTEEAKIKVRVYVG